MMQPLFRPDEQPLRDVLGTDAYDEAWFEAIYHAVDRLHDAVSECRPRDVSPLGSDEMVGWLEDIVFTAQETIVEIQGSALGATVTEAGMLS